MWLGWMSNWNYPYGLPTGDWHGEMSVPRELSLTSRDGGRVLLQNPVPELDALRGRAIDLSGTGVTDSTTDLGSGRVVDLDLVLDISGAEDVWLTLAAGRVDGRDQEVRVGVSSAAGVLYLDRTAGGVRTVQTEDGGTADFALRR